jgi:hypothetical protein
MTEGSTDPEARVPRGARAVWGHGPRFEEGVRPPSGTNVDGIQPFGIATRVDIPDDFGASWAIAARVRTRTLDPGERVEVEVFLSGVGRPESTKLCGVIPESIFDPEAGGDFSSNIAAVGTFGTDGVSRLEAAAYNPDGRPLSGGVFSITFSKGFTLPVTPAERSPSDYIVAGEQGAGGSAPALLRWTLPKWAPPGDHAVPLVLTYVTRGQAQTSAYEVLLHIRPWWERPLYQALIVVSTIVLLAAAVRDLIR